MIRQLTISAALALAVGAPPAGADDDLTAAVDTFADALAACVPATLDFPHPLLDGLFLRHEVTGEAQDGLCRYTQTMPGGIVMECAYATDGRAEMAEDLRAMVHDTSLSLPDSDPPWTEDCTIVMPDGQRLPVDEAMRLR